MKLIRQWFPAFILGFLVAVFLFHAYTVYQVRAITLQNQATLSQVVNFINQASGQAGAGAGAGAVSSDDSE